MRARGDRAVRLILEERQFQQRRLFHRQRRYRLMELLRRLPRIELGIGGGNVIGHEGGIVWVEVRPLLTPKPIDAQIPRNRENPCGNRAPGGIEPVSLVPDRDHGFLHQLLGQLTVATHTCHVGFYARRKVAKKRLKSFKIPPCTDRTEQRDHVR